MLPGFRFLFAAVVLSVSTVIFGLGAAALLRAAHEQFASLPVWKAPPETVFAQRTEPTPTLAMLNVEAIPANPPVSVLSETSTTTEQQAQQNAPVATDKDEALSTPAIVAPAASAPVVEPPAQARIEPNSAAATEAANVVTPSPKAPDQTTSTAASEPPPAAEAAVASTPLAASRYDASSGRYIAGIVRSAAATYQRRCTHAPSRAHSGHLVGHQAGSRDGDGFQCCHRRTEDRRRH
jgi:hypothetical protein